MTRLPPAFAALEPFVAQWAIPGTAHRAALRGTSTDAERQAFFAAGQPLVGAALDYLDGKALAALDEADQRLMNLMLSFAHVALAVEMQGNDETKHRPNRDQMVITRAPADF